MWQTHLVLAPYKMRNRKAMKAFWFFSALILIAKCDKAYSDKNVSVEKVEQQSVTSELVNLLNGTYFNLNEKVCQLQRNVDAIEQAKDSDHQCECNEAEMNEFKQTVSDELHDFSKILSEFENQMRILQKEQLKLREMLDNDETASSTTTTTSTTTTPTTSTPQVCAQGWISSPENKCYYVSTTSEKTEWSTAISRCTAMGARLVEIKTDEEASFIMENLPSRVSSSDIIYTGRKRNDRDDWVFLSNDKLVDTSVRTWADGDPDGGTQKCGCTRRSDDFLMLDCYCIGYDLFYICEIELAIASSTTTTTATTTTPTIPTPQVCAQGWISSPENNCYYVSTTSEKTEWSTAISRCTEMGARLVEIQTDEEASFIMENLPSRVSRNDIIYTGRKRNNRDEWIFLSSEQLVDESVRTWGDGNPDGGDQRCGCTRRSDDFLMLDCYCTGYFIFYICEIEASSTTTTPKSLTTSTPQDCDEGWVSSPEKCYYVSTKSMKTNWNMAISRCTAMGAKLAEFQTDEEASVILPYLPHRVLPYDNIYTGRKRNDRDQWVFVSNDKPVDTSVRTWGDGEPDGGSQRCGCIRRANKFLMLDCFCTGFNLFYICEIER